MKQTLSGQLGGGFRERRRRPPAIRGISVSLRTQPLEPRTTDERRDDDPSDASGEDSHADFLCEMIGFAAQRIMELDVGVLTRAGYGVSFRARGPSAQLPPHTHHERDRFMRN